MMSALQYIIAAVVLLLVAGHVWAWALRRRATRHTEADDPTYDIEREP